MTGDGGAPEVLVQEVEVHHRHGVLVGAAGVVVDADQLVFVVGEDLDCFAFWKALFDNGVFTNPVISPAVPPGQAMIRTSYTATMTDEHLDRVVEVVAKVAREKGLIS